ncbi:uncharacterized protein LOC132737781 isoform X1 [Ruditapes philippinarum]|uniref:uncharacterized protein LOC132737781 isoform X1 n=1 Tax=Ruditapes philippinarum TaxID=129788 RepID=UPI00295B55A8|nr:uncharacterized protein LOC132737781 isoform X1 [Ruditapes philippinarum]
MIVNENMFMFVILILSSIYITSSEYAPSCRNFDCEYKLLSKLIQLEEKTAQQDSKISLLTAKLEDAEKTIANLNDTIVTNQKSADGTTYIRWGRTTCPGKAVLVYDGYVAGSDHLHSGTAANPLCLPKDPDYDKYLDGFQESGRICGAEYQTNSYPKWKYLHDHEIPCAVCQIPRNNVLMVPGKDRCHDNYMLEYKGYLMSEHFKHASSSEFVCVDGNPETIKGTHQNLNGKLFHFVEGTCGSLPCNPYKNGWELTCAVCSYSYNAKSTSIQPYT